MNHPIKLLICAVAGACLSVNAGSSAGSFESWQRHRDAVATDKSLTRFYTFESVDGGVANAVGVTAPLSFKLQQKAGAPVETLRVVEGRWPQKKAVRLDQGCLASEPFAVAK